jgi:hypothetical protein
VLIWLRNLLGTKPVRDPSLTELMANMVRLEDEWRAFLEQQARVSRRRAKRDRDDGLLPAKELPLDGPEITKDKSVIRQRAIARGLFTPRRSQA